MTVATSDLVNLLIWTLILGVIAYVVNMLPIDRTFKVIGYAIIAIIFIVVLVRTFGLA